MRHRPVDAGSRGDQAEVPQGLQGAQALPAHDAAAQSLTALHAHPRRRGRAEGRELHPAGARGRGLPRRRRPRRRRGARRVALAAAYDLVVLDVMLPGRDGSTCCASCARGAGSAGAAADGARRRWRTRWPASTSAPTTTSPSRSRSRSCSPASARCSGAAPRAAPMLRDRRPRAGSRHAQVTRGGRRIELTAREFALLEYFLRNPGRVLSRALIAQHVWGVELRHVHQRDRRVRQLPPAEDRRRLRAEAHPHGARRGLRAARARALTCAGPRSLRARLTLWYTAALGGLLAGPGRCGLRPAGSRAAAQRRRVARVRGPHRRRVQPCTGAWR